VETKSEMKRFISFHHDLYEGNEYDAPTLVLDDLRTFNPKKNAAFEFSEAEFYIAYDGDEVVGRVAAIINHRANEKWKRKEVRFGWIDFVDDIRVSKALLNAVEDYGRRKGMNLIVGPLGFTDMDPEGMLIDGFDQLGTMATSYNYPYYPKHMEQMEGWEKDNDYVEYKLMVPPEMPEKYKKVSEMIMKRYNLHIKKLNFWDVYFRGYGIKVFNVVNETFKDLYGYSEMTHKQIMQYINMYMPFADTSLFSVIEDGNADNKVVGIGLTIPSLTRALQKCKHGKLLPFGWFHILKALKFHESEVVDLLLIGVLPEYRSKGANALMFYDLIPRYIKYGFKWGETHVEMETNAHVQSQWQYLERYQHKHRRCYRKNISEQ